MGNKGINSEGYLKVYLGDFFTPNIHRFIIDEINKLNITINSNIILNIRESNFGYIKSIVSTLLLKEGVEEKYYATSIYKLVQEDFNNNFEDIRYNSDYIENIDHLILYEFNDMDHKLYDSIIGNLLSIRLMKGLYNFIILTSKPIEKIISNKNIINYFTVINFNSKKMLIRNNSVSDSSNTIDKNISNMNSDKRVF